MATTSGLKMNSANVLQLIKETTPGTYDAGGERTVATMFRIEPQPETVYESHKPQGWNSRAWNAITREHTVFSGALRLNFPQLPILFDMLCGPAVSDSGTPRVRVWEMKDTGPDARQTYTAEYGQVNEASRHAYLLLASLAINFMRMTENNEGSVTLLAKQSSADDLIMTSNATITGTDLADAITPTGTAATPENAVDADLGTDAVFDTGETIIFDLGSSKVLNGIKVTKGASGGHASGVLALQRAVTGGGSFTTTETVWSITDTDDGSWADGASKYGTFDGHDGSQHYRLIYTASSGSLAISQVEFYEDATTSLQASTEIPLVAQMWTVRRAAAIGDLAAATAIPRVKGFALDVPDRTLLHWFFDEHETNFTDWVQGEGEPTVRLTMVNDVDGVAADLTAKAKELPAEPEWWNFRCDHPDLDYRLDIDAYLACSGNIPYGNESNVRHKEFPLVVMLNDQGWMMRFTLTTPS